MALNLLGSKNRSEVPDNWSKQCASYKLWPPHREGEGKKWAGWKSEKKRAWSSNNECCVEMWHDVPRWCNKTTLRMRDATFHSSIYHLSMATPRTATLILTMKYSKKSCWRICARRRNGRGVARGGVLLLVLLHAFNRQGQEIERAPFRFSFVRQLFCR